MRISSFVEMLVFICLHHNTVQLCRQEISCKVLKLLYPHLFQSLIGKKILPLPLLPVPDRTVKPAAVRTKARSAETPNAAARFSLVRSPFPSDAFETGCPCLPASGKRTARFRLRRGPCGARFLPAHSAARVPWSRRFLCFTPPFRRLPMRTRAGTICQRLSPNQTGADAIMKKEK